MHSLNKRHNFAPKPSVSYAHYCKKWEECGCAEDPAVGCWNNESTARNCFHMQLLDQTYKGEHYTRLVLFDHDDTDWCMYMLDAPAWHWDYLVNLFSTLPLIDPWWIQHHLIQLGYKRE